MSSILRALKKLENETPQESEFKSFPKKLDTKKAIKRSAKRTWRFSRFSYACFAVIIIAGVGWFFLNQKQPSIEKVSHDTIHFPDLGKEVTKTPSAPVKKTIGRIPLQDEKIEVPPKRPKRIPEKDHPRPNALQKKIFIRDGAKKSDVAAKEDRKHGIKKQPTPLEKKGASGLKLQAIAWSSSPKKRIAVINSYIVREGDSIEGFHVTRIGTEVVVIRKGETEWELVFKLK